MQEPLLHLETLLVYFHFSDGVSASYHSEVVPGGASYLAPSIRTGASRWTQRRSAWPTTLMGIMEDFNDKFEKPMTKEFIVALKRWGVELPSPIKDKDWTLFYFTPTSWPRANFVSLGIINYCPFPFLMGIRVMELTENPNFPFRARGLTECGHFPHCVDSHPDGSSPGCFCFMLRFQEKME